MVTTNISLEEYNLLNKFHFYRVLKLLTLADSNIKWKLMKYSPTETLVEDINEA